MSYKCLPIHQGLFTYDDSDGSMHMGITMFDGRRYDRVVVGELAN
jgi:hypothetical protein